MKNVFRWVLLSVLLPVPALSSFAEDNPGMATYQTCAACHLPDGVGIPGAFPPIRNRAARIAALDGGREYLISAISYGLMGTIEVDGASYFGIMAGNSATMTAEDIAAVLNYITGELSDAGAETFEPFTTEEIIRVQESVINKSPQAAGATREQLVEQHGTDWP